MTPAKDKDAKANQTMTSHTTILYNVYVYLVGSASIQIPFSSDPGKARANWKKENGEIRKQNS